MKKIYLLLVAIGFSFSANAQLVNDDMEGYTTGDISAQASHWRTWSGVDGGADDGEVVNSPQSPSGDQSLLMDGSGVTDLVLLVPGFPNTGIYTVQFRVTIPSNKSFYFNMQADLTAEGNAWQQALMGGNVYFNCDGSSGGSGGVTGVTDCSAFDQEFTYNQGVPIRVTCVYDLDSEVWSMKIDGVDAIIDQPFDFGGQTFEGLAGLNFFSASTNNEGYVDDILIQQGVLGVDDFSADVFSVYPNPVQDVLNIKSAAAVNEVVVYDILGKVVLQSRPDAISPSINMSGLNSGAYMVKVTIDGASKTIKVIK